MAKREGTKSDNERRLIQGGFNGMTAWQLHVKEEAQGPSMTSAPVDTSRLAKSIREDAAFPIETSPLVFVGQVGAHTEYARAHELGSGIYSLDPNEREHIRIEAGFWTGKSQSKALNFPWKDGPTDHPAYNESGPYAGTFTFRAIMHPGIRPAHDGKGYLRYSARESVTKGRRMMLLAMKNALVKGR
jgi:hypothetical protein